MAKQFFKLNGPAVFVLLIVLSGTASARVPQKTLDFYFIDVEGGAATLIVTPAGESLLIDTGFPGDRDAQRIAHVALNVAGLKQIDHCVVTHWHRDHEGGVPALAKLVPIRNYYDHGLPAKFAEDMQAEYINAYKETTQGKSMKLSVGDRINLARAKGSPAIGIRVLTADGMVLGDTSADPQIRPCGDNFQPKADDVTDNAKSIGVVLTFGAFRFFNGGDISWNIESRLACPKNIAGVVDFYQVNHHGVDSSNNPVLVRALNPRVALIDNGPRKGAEAATFATLKSVPAIQAIYQLHRNLRATDKENTMSGYIANEDEACAGNFIKVSVAADSRSYVVSIPAKQVSRTYRTR